MLLLSEVVRKAPVIMWQVNKDLKEVKEEPQSYLDDTMHMAGAAGAPLEGWQNGETKGGG